MRKRLESDIQRGASTDRGPRFGPPLPSVDVVHAPGHQHRGHDDRLSAPRSSPRPARAASVPRVGNHFGLRHTRNG